MSGLTQRQGPIEVRAFHSNTLEDGTVLNFMPDGICQIIDTIGDNNIDFAVPFDCKINGIQPILKNHDYGDYLRMEIGVVHPTYGWVVLKNFGVKYYVDDSVQNQGILAVNYSAVVPAISTGLQIYIRIIYHKADASLGTKCIFNFLLHEVKDAPV